MNRRALGILVGSALCGVFLTWSAGSSPKAALPAPAAGSPRPAGDPPHVTSPSPVPTLRRNLFEYADQHGADPRPVLRVTRPSTPSATPTPAIRLVGFVRKGEALSAALSIAGEVVVAAAGEENAGYTVLSVDEEAGVRLLDPEGREILLPPS